MLPSATFRPDLQVPSERTAVQPGHLQPDLLLHQQAGGAGCKEIVLGEDSFVEAGPS